MGYFSFLVPTFLVVHNAVTKVLGFCAELLLMTDVVFLREEFIALAL